MKKTIKAISLGLAICLLALSLCGCNTRTDEEKIRDRVSEFVTALNTGDSDGLLACLDAKSRNAYNAVFNITEGILGGLIGFGVNIKDLFALAIGFTDGNVLAMEIQEVQITSEKTATVRLTATVNMSGQSNVETVSLDMVKEKDDWYISLQADWSSLY